MTYIIKILIILTKIKYFQFSSKTYNNEIYYIVIPLSEKKALTVLKFLSKDVCNLYRPFCIKFQIVSLSLGYSALSIIKKTIN